MYSTANSNWEVLGSFESGQVIEMDLIINAYHKVSAISGTRYGTIMEWIVSRLCLL